VDAYGLKALSGSDSEVEVKEDVPEMAQSYKVGDNLQFTASLKAVYDPELKQESDAKEDGVIDVEVEEA